MSQSVYPNNGIYIVDAWRRTNPPLQAHVERSPDLYRRVIAQFDVCNNPRYRAGRLGRNETYCNIFVWDVTCALGCEIPHWVDKDGHSPCEVGKGSETDANAMVDWLMEDHHAHPDTEEGYNGAWFEVPRAEVPTWTAKGMPVVATWKAARGDGHVAIVLPSHGDGSIRLAVAGRRNFFDCSVAASFGNLPIRYFAHR